MTTTFQIKSNDPAMLEKARQIARDFVQPFLGEDVIGIVFLGAIVRGYFDASADIDIGIVTKPGATLALPGMFSKVEEFEVQCWVSDYESELRNPWEMSKRWTYSQGQIYYDPSGKIAKLLTEKVPLRLEEQKWLMMSGLTLSEWYINRLTYLWVERGNLISAHHMFDQGLNYFFDLLFGLNHQLVADMKWRFYCAEKLERLPDAFQEKIKQVMTVQALTLEELERRRTAFMEMWQELKPVVETEVHMTFAEMLQVV